jgi:hypothetical protein
MRKFQVILFLLGALAFIVAAFCTGTIAGDALWRAGMAAMLGDLVCLKLWPTRLGGKPGSESREHQRPFP